MSRKRFTYDPDAQQWDQDAQTAAPAPAKPQPQRYAPKYDLGAIILLSIAVSAWGCIVLVLLLSCCAVPPVEWWKVAFAGLLMLAVGPVAAWVMLMFVR